MWCVMAWYVVWDGVMCDGMVCGVCGVCGVLMVWYVVCDGMVCGVGWCGV